MHPFFHILTMSFHPALVPLVEEETEQSSPITYFLYKTNSEYGIFIKK